MGSHESPNLLPRFVTILSLIFLLVPGYALSRDNDNAQVDQKAIMYRKVHEMEMRAIRDKEQAEGLRKKALGQIKEAESLMEAAKNGKTSNAQAVIDLGEKTIDEANGVIAKADREIEEANRRIQESSQACKILEGYNQAALPFDGVTMPFWRKGMVDIKRAGRDETVEFDFAHDMLIPGDCIYTGKDGAMGVASVLSKSHNITVGHETLMKLESDDAKGTLWMLGQGDIHVVPMGVKDKTNLRIETSDAIYEPEKGSEFDIHVNAQGKSVLTLYKGSVPHQEKKQGFTPTQETPPKWWEELIKEPDNKKDAK